LISHEIPPRKRTGPKVICEQKLALYDDAALSEYQVKYWSKQFKWGRKSIKDDPHPGKLVEVTSPKI